MTDDKIVHLNAKIQVHRGTSEAWKRNNPVLEDGEFGFELDTGLLKIGRDSRNYTDLPYINDGAFLEIDPQNKNGLNMSDKGLGLELATPTAAGAMSSDDKKHLDSMSNIYDTVKFELVKDQLPAGCRVTTRDDEVRIMFPSDTQWTEQHGGGDPNAYYMAIKLFAPSDDVVGFKRGQGKEVTDEFIECTTSGDTGGIDKYGRKFYIAWLPVARKVEGVWQYFGEKSTAGAFIGWYITIEWYTDRNGKAIASETIRINLSNEECHNDTLPYYTSQIPITWGTIQ